jgi:Low-density lipoprotein receptor repeat class B
MRVFHSIIVIVLALGSASSSSGLGLFWNDDRGIHRYLSSDPLGSPALFETFETRGMAVDPTNARLWWSDILPLGAPLPGGVIRTGSTMGGAVTDVVTHLTSPAGVALDAQRGRIYWSDLGDVNNASAIFSANLDGSDVQKLVSGVFISEIAGIALDPIHDKLYFTYINPLIDSLLTGGIARADLDGSNLELIVGGQGKPIGIAVDATGGGIYWADAMSISPAGGNGAIKAADLDGQYQRTILGGLSVPYGVALDLGKQSVYWTDMATGKIQRTVMSGSLPYFQDVLTGLTSPTAIVIVPTPPGDYNQNGIVDAADYVVWRKSPDAFGGDPAGYDTWRSHFGQSAGSGSALNATVPEPATTWLFLIGMLVILSRRSATVP